MKRLLLTPVLFVSALALTCVGAQAQSETATIPFDFMANGKRMPPGDYTVSRLSNSVTKMYKMVENETHQAVLLNGVINMQNKDGAAKLVFRQTGGGLYLTEVWDGSNACRVASPHARNGFLASVNPVIIGLK
jgi:hypothetical protein